MYVIDIVLLYSEPQRIVYTSIFKRIQVNSCHLSCTLKQCEETPATKTLSPYQSVVKNLKIYFLI